MKNSLRISATACLLLCTASAAPTFQSPDGLLARARLAAQRPQWSMLEQGLRFTGTTRGRGVDATFELCFRADGAYRYETDGPLAQVSTWDSDESWSAARGGPARPLRGAELDASLLAQWVHSGWWADAGDALRVEPIEDQPELRLSFPSTGVEALLTLDPETALPRRLSRNDNGFEALVEFSDYRPVAGIPIAHRVDYSQAGVRGFVRIEAAGPDPDPAGDRFGLRGRRATDVRFNPEAPAEVELRRVASGHLLVNPRVDGRDVGWFILDTGAGQLCIDPGAADRLELPEFGEVPAVGNAGTVLASFRQGASFVLGPLEQRDPVYVELELDFLEPVFGVPIAGICGYDLFARAIVQLDLDGPSLWLHDPAGFEVEDATWIDLEVQGGLPCVICSFEGDRSGLFRIDTGDSGSVTFHSPAVRQLGLLEGRETRPAMLGGVGGSAEARSGRLDWFTLGDRRFEDVVTTFTTNEQGAHADAASLGTIGSGLLRPFVVVFDYPGERLGLIARSQ
ncbi:retropepsin-like aspartic protease [Engelhardtia mirabilis]|uniref:Aspartyl protease n=1 Tax=Engelhardtia mirabilis TaxID=2528011 RepID=A0A518BMQ2_9BACT|nr:hypothetical protein Pla133_33530 [Planctomycetes bacterium Pla133]QDV02584.1 hypothetical protein Pla86_33520 [Planctomycetes bacterium Pla86]